MESEENSIRKRLLDSAQEDFDAPALEWPGQAQVSHDSDEEFRFSGIDERIEKGSLVKHSPETIHQVTKNALKGSLEVSDINQV